MRIIRKIRTFDHIFGIDVQMVNNLSYLATTRKRSFDHFSGVQYLHYHISLSFFDMEAIWFVIVGSQRNSLIFKSSAISSEDSLM